MIEDKMQESPELVLPPPGFKTKEKTLNSKISLKKGKDKNKLYHINRDEEQSKDRNDNRNIDILRNLSINLPDNKTLKLKISVSID